jgi:3-deoxy-D-manno-octulosonic-acid transferase
MWYLGYLLYLISTNSYFLVIKIISPFNKRAKLFVEGRKDLIELITKKIVHDSRKSIWFHVASLGEFEQARPVIEELKLIYPYHKIIVTVFSPSGYEPRKNDSIADYIFYLPNDSQKNAQALVKLFKPSLVFWVKYDFWYHYLIQLKNNNIPTFLIAASFHSNQIYFKKYAVFYKQLLSDFSFIFTQNETSTKLLNTININHVQTTGDTRFDRVFNTLKQTENLPLIELFKGDNLLIVIGSSYKLEEEMLTSFLNEYQGKNYKLIIAPHFINEERLLEIEKIIPKKIIRYSNANATNIFNYQSLVIDNIGMLNQIYKYADISFIGGGFKNKGLHNILEAATFGNAIIFGNKIGYFPEAIEFVKIKGALCVKNQEEFNSYFNKLLTDDLWRNELGDKAKQEITANTGATEKIIKYISKAYLHLN